MRVLLLTSMMLTLTVMGSVSLVQGAVPGDLVWAQHENIISNRDDYFRDVAVDASGIYVVGPVFHAGTDSEWRIEKEASQPARPYGSNRKTLLATKTIL